MNTLMAKTGRYVLRTYIQRRDAVLKIIRDLELIQQAETELSDAPSLAIVTSEEDYMRVAPAMLISLAIDILKDAYDIEKQRHPNNLPF